MQYKITVKDDKCYVLASIYAPITREFITELNHGLVEQARKHGRKRFLYDVRNSANVADVLDNYLIAYEDSYKVGFDRLDTFAIVHDKNDTSHDFIKTVARNAGFNLSLFTDTQKAVEWLCANDKIYTKK